MDKGNRIDGGDYSPYIPHPDRPEIHGEQPNRRSLSGFAVEEAFMCIPAD